MPFVVEVICESCGHRWEEWLSSSSEEPGGCSNCGSTRVTKIPGGNLARCNDPQVRSEVLKKRSYDHSVAHAAENAERALSKIKPK